MIEKMKSLIREKDTCVLATVAGDEPHCSLMSYVADDDGLSLYMLSRRGTRKHGNLKSNERVSLLIDTREDAAGRDRGNVRALTVRGVFRSIDDDARRGAIREKLLDRHPPLRELAGHPDVDVFEVRAVSFELLEGVSRATFVEVA